MSAKLSASTGSFFVTSPILRGDRIYADGILACEKISHQGKSYLRFYDKCKPRVVRRGTPFVCVALEDIVNL